MNNTARKMRLTPDLVARCHREVADPGPSPSTRYLLDSDFRPEAERILAKKPPGPMLLFAYGSLIWKPEIPHVSMKKAVAPGWHRAFAMKIERFRGSPDQPGYMMCLDRGGSCDGVVLELAPDNLTDQMEKLLRREVSRHGGLEAVRWIGVEAEDGPATALAFYAAPSQLENYHPETPPQTIAHALARACGHWGSGTDYLYNTVSHLEQMGIHDPHLWHLQELVAEEIENLSA